MRPKLPKVSEQMKAWSAALGEEIASWPHVVQKPFFGLTALYRDGQIFGLLPRTRAIETQNALGFRLENVSSKIHEQITQDRRMRSTRMRSARWFIFEISADADLHTALDWLGQAHKAAGTDSKRSKSTGRK